ncbi:CUBN-like protein, partial [Mya arenaria]
VASNYSVDSFKMYFDDYSTDRLCGVFNRRKRWLTKANHFEIFFKSGNGRNTERGFRLLWKGVGTTFLTSSNAPWSQAKEMCSEEGGTMLTDADDTYIELSKEDLAAQMDVANLTEAWIGRYYTPWSWLKGCYTYTDDMLPERAGYFKSNQQSTCIEYCHDSNYFGLKIYVSTTPRVGMEPFQLLGMIVALKSVTWNGGRDGCRFSTSSDGEITYSMADTRHVLTDSGHYYWVGYRRTVRTVSDLSGSFIDCFRVTRNENGISLGVNKCTEEILPITCGEIYNEGIRGKFNFPNTTRTYDPDHNCVWKILATPAEKIEIYIEFDLEDSVVCMCDKIKIYDNDAPEGHPNKTLCGRGNITFYSSGPTVVIQFISDESVNGTGFNVSWKVEKEEHTTTLLTTTMEEKEGRTTIPSTTTVQVWFIPAVSSAAVVFVVLITTLICFWRRHKRPREEVKEENVFTNSAYTEFDKNETITTGDKMHGSPKHSDSDRLDDTIDTYATVQEPSDFLSSENKTRNQPRIAANISQNDDYTNDNYNSLNATFSKSPSNQTDNVYNHIPNDANEYSVSISFNAKPMNTQTKGTDNVYNTLPKTEEKHYDHADLSGIPDNRTGNESDQTYNKLPRTTDNEYDSTCSHTRVADHGEYNYISK